MESIGAAISPAKGAGDQIAKGTFLTDLTPVAPKTSRFKTPSARMSIRSEELEDDLIPSNGLKYLQSGKMEKETVMDYISTSRLMLRKNLTNEARKKDLTNVKANYQKEVEALKEAETAFEEDY